MGAELTTLLSISDHIIVKVIVFLFALLGVCFYLFIKYREISLQSKAIKEANYLAIKKFIESDFKELKGKSKIVQELACKKLPGFSVFSFDEWCLFIEYNFGLHCTWRFNKALKAAWSIYESSDDKKSYTFSKFKYHTTRIFKCLFAIAFLLCFISSVLFMAESSFPLAFFSMFFLVFFEVLMLMSMTKLDSVNYLHEKYPQIFAHPLYKPKKKGKKMSNDNQPNEDDVLNQYPSDDCQPDKYNDQSRQSQD